MSDAESPIVDADDGSPLEEVAAGVTTGLILPAPRRNAHDLTCVMALRCRSEVLLGAERSVQRSRQIQLKAVEQRHIY